MRVQGAVRVDKFQRQLQYFRKEFSKDARLELKRQARLFVYDCIKFTPPFTPATHQEPFNVQRAVGERATVRDIGKVFVGTENVGPRASRTAQAIFGSDPAIPGLKFLEGNPKLKAQVRKYVAAGNIEAIQTLLNRMNITAPVIRTPDPDLHRLRRNNRGRVRKGGQRWIVMDTQSLKSYVRHKVGHVGLAKSGWQRPYYAVGGQKLPQWISRHPVRGIYESGHDDAGFYERVGNDIPWIQGTGAELHIIGRATQNRIRNLSIEMAKLVAHNRRKAGFGDIGSRT